MTARDVLTFSERHPIFYAEKIEGTQIAERGIFYSLEEFIPYRLKGWSGAPETDEAADALIAVRQLPDSVLRYIAPMQLGELERYELRRRFSLTP